MKHSTLTWAAALTTIFIFSGFLISDNEEKSKSQEAPPVEWTIDQAHSQVNFKVRHLGITNVTGNFKDFDMTLVFDPQNLQTLQTTATVEVSTIDTGIERRDNHLRSDDFFNAEQYPELTFVSTGVTDIEGNTFKLMGDLTIRDVTKPVVLEAEMIGTAPGTDGKMRAGFTAKTTIDRMEYGLKWDKLTEAGGLVVSHDVEVLLEVQAVRAES